MAAANPPVVIATDNPGKLAEIRQLLPASELDIRPQSEFGIEGASETGLTFRENALIKARHASAKAGLAAIADDSGLEVDALDGRPGVRSARFAGEAATDEQNIDRLLADLREAPEPHYANFRCVAVYVDGPADASPLIAEGSWHGRILAVRLGHGGFGYDPVFFDPLRGRTAAEMNKEQKNAVSHRGRAFRELSLLIDERLRRAAPA